jgi:hypothetical protein
MMLNFSAEQQQTIQDNNLKNITEDITDDIASKLFNKGNLK